MATAVRMLSADAVEKANSGHPGMPLGMADVATVLFTKFLKFNPKDPKWPNRDRFVLSGGHGSMLLYSMLYLNGYEDATIEGIKNFRQWQSPMAGHPEYGHLLGIETTTGPLGQGLATAVGMALGERMLHARLKDNDETSDDLINHYTYVTVGDGDLMEGISQEAISLAGHLGLNRLIVLFDDNNITIDGKASLSTSEDTLARFTACGWNTISIDGHDYGQITNAIIAAQNSTKPTLIACKTMIGHGAPNKAGTSNCHGSPLGAEEIKALRTNLNWPHDPFVIPDDILKQWRESARRYQIEYQEWNNKFNAASENVKNLIGGREANNWQEKINLLKEQITKELPKQATRQLSQKVLEDIAPSIHSLIGGSADLTASNNTKVKGHHKDISANDFSGNYINYGIREHGMAAAMSGLALYGCFIPYGGTFLVFSDYLRPALRLSALMAQRVIYVLTHDSIGLGEDGPTHQPIEHLASLRAIPGVNVFRPADGVEVAECWQLALESNSSSSNSSTSITGPSVLALSRQAIATVRTTHTAENLCAKGGYVLLGNSDESTVTLIATGTEVTLAVQAFEKLQEQGINAHVVSMPCLRLFDMQNDAYKKGVLGKGKRIAIEAGCSFGWHKYLRDGDVFIGHDDFGASAPAGILYEKFGITVEAIIKASR